MDETGGEAEGGAKMRRGEVAVGKMKKGGGEQEQTVVWSESWSWSITRMMRKGWEDHGRAGKRE